MGVDSVSKRPAFQFYPADWRTDPGLRLCALVSRGLWMEMMAIMHEGEPYGHLTAQGRPISPDMLARLVGESPATVKRCMADLEANGVFSRTDDGVIYSRRMVRDEEVREARAAGGSLGKVHGQKGASHGTKGGRPRKEKPPLVHDERGVILPPPSSSSSSSSSIVVDGDGAHATDFADLADDLTRMAGVRHMEPGRIAEHIDLVREWVSRGASPADLRATVGSGVSAASSPIHHLRYFDGAVRLMIAKRNNAHGSNGAYPAAADELTSALARAAAADEAGRRSQIPN
ncbi:hypothetical protein [Sphingobium sp. WCS2017Hpa-17]|uniref:hypothetical protein n=1 Tax=Sphingobium sp. WCS2017Hpa-17 TaxID=3073638 RepID=UPI00288B59BF|nr:hypothetical protein [Sphingobium sp. WCS2017Hpa-17]